MSVTIPAQRHLFDIPRDLAYLNCAYASPLARPVREAMAEGFTHKVRPWEHGADEYFSIPEDTRTAFACLFGAANNDMAIVPSAGYGLAVAARNVPVCAGQEIVLLAHQFPANVYIWREKAKDTGAKIITVERRAEEAWTRAVLDAINANTAIVALPNCHWADGGLVDLETVGVKCREVGAALVLDLTQSLGALPFDVQRVDPDFAVSTCYKWMMGPYGIGALYVAPRHQNGRPIEQTWAGRKNAEDFARLVDYQDAYQPGARRFDMAEKSNPPLLLGARAAVEMLLAWDVHAIAHTLAARNAALAEHAKALGYTTLGADVRAGHFLSISHPDGLPANLPDRLAAEQVHVSLRGNSLRITPHLYNDDQDCDLLIAVLKAVRG